MGQELNQLIQGASNVGGDFMKAFSGDVGGAAKDLGGQLGSIPGVIGQDLGLGKGMPAMNTGVSGAQGNYGANLNAPSATITTPQVGGGGAAGGVEGLSTAGSGTILAGSTPPGMSSSTNFGLSSYTPNDISSLNPTLTPTSATPSVGSTVTAANDPASSLLGTTPGMSQNAVDSMQNAKSGMNATGGAAQPDMMNSMAQYLMNPQNIPRELSTALTGVNLMNAMQPNPLQKQMQHQLDNARNQQALYQNRVNTDQAGGVSPAQQAALDLERQQARARILSQPGGILSAQNADLQAVDTAINKQQFDEAQANLAQDAKLMGAYDTDTQNYLTNLLKLEEAQSGQFNQSLASLFQALGMGNPANYGNQPTR